VLVDLQRNAQGVFEDLLREGVVVRPMQGYGLPECIRVSVGTERQMDIFSRALKKVLGL
jgi:histidinol-phosphate aminotransferase